MNFSVITLGCKANYYDSECIKDTILKDKKYLYNDNLKIKSDIYIINTCAVTNISESKSRKTIRRCTRINDKAIIVVVGCYSQIASDKIASIPNVNIVLGNSNKENVYHYLQKYFANPNKQIIDIKNILFKKKYEQKTILSAFKNKTRAYVKIQDGCDNFCSFCIIPYTRGKLRSRNPLDIITEIRLLVKNNYKEIILTGIHTAGYGDDLHNYSFFDLLYDIETKIIANFRVRISSIEISQLSSKIINLLKTSKKIVPHLHVPLQSGSDKILNLMERKYNCKQYLDMIKILRKNIPSIAITTDLIIGFPNEDETAFKEIIEFIQAVSFSEIHVFPYSPKTNTPAADMKQVDPKIKKKRVAKVIEINKQLAEKYINQLKSNVFEVLFERKIPDSSYYYGYSREYIKIKCYSEKNIKNKIMNVKITEISYPCSVGKIIKDV